MQSKKINFKVRIPVDKDDPENKETKEVELSVITPTIEQINEAQGAFNTGFDSAIRSKAPLRIEVEKILKEKKIWTEEKEDTANELSKELNEKINKLRAGNMKLLDGRKLALEICDIRGKLARLNSDRRALDLLTAEAQAENARFNWFVANCVVYANTGKPFFENVNDYLMNSSTEYAAEAARQFGVLQYGLDQDFEKKLPENKFLLKFKFVRDKDLRLVNRSGDLVDREMNPVDEEGFKLDKDGNRIDFTGTPLNADGSPKIEEKPFLDDEGNPVVVD